MNEEQNELYSEFIKKGLSAGFTDDQINFMWEFIMMTTLSMIRMNK